MQSATLPKPSLDKTYIGVGLGSVFLQSPWCSSSWWKEDCDWRLDPLVLLDARKSFSNNSGDICTVCAPRSVCIGVSYGFGIGVWRIGGRRVYFLLKDIVSAGWNCRARSVYVGFFDDIVLGIGSVCAIFGVGIWTQSFLEDQWINARNTEPSPSTGFQAS